MIKHARLIKECKLVEVFLFFNFTISLSPRNEQDFFTKEKNQATLPDFILHFLLRLCFISYVLNRVLMFVESSFPL